ncbi:MAG: hypothetical protein EBR82_67300 [Caulobacteraceae bacterium]|nr:hypothetical protein [Caulobacteraceae bacterium]
MSKEALAQWMIQRGYATGHGDSVEDLLQELDWQIAENWNRALINGITTEREARAKVQEFVCSTGSCRFTLTQTNLGIKLKEKNE